MNLKRLFALGVLVTGLALFRVSPAHADTAYTVRPGDTLTRIAARFNTTVDELVRVNNLSNPNALQVGQVLTIPDGTAAPAPAPTGATTYVVRPGDSLARIAARHGTSVEALIALNGLATTTLQPGQVLLIPATSAHPTGSIYARIQGSSTFIQRTSAALDWLQAHDPDAFQRVETYITVITPSPYAHLATAQPLPGGGCRVRALARSTMPVEMVAAILFHEATHCYQFATVGLLSDKEAEVWAYTEQIAFMERHGFPPEVIDYYRRVLAYYAGQPDDGGDIPPPAF